MSSQSENQDTEKTKVSYFSRIIYILRDFLDGLKRKTRSIIYNLESHKSFEFYGLYMLICVLSITTNIKFDWIYFTIISLKVLINATNIGFAPLVLVISLYLFFDIIIYLSIPYTLISEALDIGIPCVLYYCMHKLGFLKEFKFEYTFVVIASFLTLQMIVWLGFLIHPLSAIIKYFTYSMLSSNSIVKADSLYKRRGIFFLIMNEKRDFGDGFSGLMKLWKYEFNRILAAHCTTFLIFLVFLYIYHFIKSKFDFICSLIGIIIPRSPIITIKDLSENSVELYWYEPIDHSNSIDGLKGVIQLIGYYIAYPFKRYSNKSSTSSKIGVDNTLSDLISISKQHGENTYHFSLNNKDTTSNKLKFPKSTSINNFTTTHYEKEMGSSDSVKNEKGDHKQNLDTSDHNKENKNEQQQNSSNADKTSKHEKTNSPIGYSIKNENGEKGGLNGNGKILLDGKEVDIRNFATEIKKEIKHFDKSFNYEESLKNATGLKLFIFKYGFQKRNEITYQVEVNGYILNEENLREKHIVINGLKPSTSYKIRVWAIMSNGIKSPSSFVNIKTLKSYTESLNKEKITKSSINEKSNDSYEDHLKVIAKIDNDIIEINEEFERLKKQRLEFNKQVNDINEQYREEEIPLRKQLDELMLEKNEVDEIKSQHKSLLKELKEDKRRVDIMKSQREQGLKTKERGKQQLIDRCNRCQTDIDKLKKDIQRLKEKEESFNIVYEEAKKEYNENKEKFLKEQNQLKDKLKEEKKNHRALVKELNDKKAKYKQIETSHRKIMQNNRERNKEKLKVDEEYKVLLKKYKEIKEKNISLKNQLKMENKEKIKLLQDLNEIHQKSDSEDYTNSDNDEEDLLEPVDSISDDLASNSTLSKSNSDPSTNTPSYSNTNSVISRNSSEENNLSKTTEFNLFNSESYEGIQNDNQYTKSSRNSSPLSAFNAFKNRYINNNNNNNNINNNNNKLNSVNTRFYSYPLENQNSFNMGGLNNSSSNNEPSSLYDRSKHSFNNNKSNDNNNESLYSVNSPRQKQKQNPKLKNLIPFFSYNSYVPSPETSTDSKLLSTSLEDDVITEPQSNINTNNPSKGVFNTNSENTVSPLTSSLTQATMNTTLPKVSPNINTTFSPQISNISPLLLNVNNPLNSASSGSNYNTSIFSNILKNNYNKVNLGSQGSVTSSLNINSLYAPINNPITNDTSTMNITTSTNAPNTINNNNTNNLGFLFSGGGLGKDKSLNGFTNNPSSLDNTFSSPIPTSAQLNSSNDLTHSSSLRGNESSLSRNNFSPMISPQTTNTSLMSGFSSIPSYYQNLNMSNDVNDILGGTNNSSSFPLDSTRNDPLKDSNERNNNFGNNNNNNNNNNNKNNNNNNNNNPSTSNYLFNNYFSMPNYPKPNNNTDTSSKDNSYLHDYLNSRLAGYQSFYEPNMFNSGLSGGYFNEPSSTGTFNTMTNNDVEFSNQQNNNVHDEDIGLNFTYNLELSDSESEDVDTSDIDISKIIDLSKKNEIKK